MRKICLIVMALSLTLMSCENVKKKSDEFSARFETAMKSENYSEAEKIAKEAQTYYDGLSESNQKEYSQYAPKYEVRLAALSYNKKYYDANGRVLNSFKSLPIGAVPDFTECDKIAKEAQLYGEKLSGTEADVYYGQLRDFEEMKVQNMAIYYVEALSKAVQDQDDTKAQAYSILSDKYLNSLNPKYQKVYEEEAKRVANSEILWIKSR